MLASLAVQAMLGIAPIPAPGHAGVPHPPPCEVSGATASVADVQRAQSACDVAQARFADLFGGPVPSVRVVLWEDARYRTGIQGGRAVIYWPTGAVLDARGQGPAEYAADPWLEVLPHEIAHVLLAARFFGTGLKAAAENGGYGTPLPDWVDEGVAIWAEPPASRRGRLREARALITERQSLRAILTGSHPALSNAQVMAMRDGGVPPEDPDLFAFYPQALAVLAFIHDAGGAPATLELVIRLKREDPVAAVVGLPGLGRSFEDVEDAWRDWLARGSVRSAAAR